MTKQIEAATNNSVATKIITALLYVSIACFVGSSAFPVLSIVAGILLLPCVPSLSSLLSYGAAAGMPRGTIGKRVLLDLSTRINVLFLGYPGYDFPRWAAFSLSALALELICHKGFEDQAMCAVRKALKLSREYNLREPILASSASLVCGKLMSANQFPESETFSLEIIKVPLTDKERHFSYLALAHLLSLTRQNKAAEAIDFCTKYWSDAGHPYQHLMLSNVIAAMQQADKRAEIRNFLAQILDQSLSRATIDIPAHEFSVKAWLLNEDIVSKDLTQGVSKFAELLSIASNFELKQTDLNLFGTLATNTLMRNREVWTEEEEALTQAYVTTVENTFVDTESGERSKLLRELARALNVYSVMLFRRKKFNDALETYSRKLNIELNLKESDTLELFRAHLGVGRTLIKLGRLEEAIDELNAGLISEKTSQDGTLKTSAIVLTHQSLAEVNIMQKQIENARKHLDATLPILSELRTDSNLPPINLKLNGWICLEEGNLSEAELNFNECAQAIEKRPDLIPILRDELAELYRQLREKQKTEKVSV